MSIGAINSNPANMAVSNSYPKPDSEAKIEAAKVLGSFAAEVNGPISMSAFDKSNLRSMLTNSHFDGELKKNVEIPQNVRSAAKLILDDEAMFDRVDSSNDNLLSFEELNAFASTNATISKMFNI